MKKDAFLRFVLEKKALLILCFLVLAISPYIYISIYANPIADDFYYAHKGQISGLCEALTFEYFHWNGRYISNFFVLINPLVFNSFLWYKIVPVLLIFSSITSIYFFMKSLIGRSLQQAQVWQISLLLFLLYAYSMPDLSEGFYWYTGAVTYQLGNIFAMLYLSMLLLYTQEKFLFNSKAIHLVTLCTLLLIIIGFNEVIMLIMASLSLVLLLIAHRSNLKSKNLFLYLLIFTALCSLIVLLAPGNATREGYFPNKHNLLLSIGYSFLQTIRFSLEWLSSAPLLLLSVLYFYLNKELSRTNSIFSNSFYLTPALSSLFLFATIFLSVFPAYWGTGILGQHRTVNVACFCFTIMWFINLSVWFNHSNRTSVQLPDIAIRYRFLILFLIGASILFTRNGYNITNDISSGRAKDYDTQMKMRYETISTNRTASNDTIYFKPINNPPKSLFVLDITNNPKHWLNNGYCLYFNLKNKCVVRKEPLYIK